MYLLGWYWYKRVGLYPTSLTYMSRALERKLLQSPSFEFGPSTTQDLRRRTEIMPVKRFPHQNKTVGFGHRPRPLHNRFTRTDTCVRWGMHVAHSRRKSLTVSLPKRFRNGRFTSETTTWIQKYLKNPLGLLESPIYNSFSRRRQWAWL